MLEQQTLTTSRCCCRATRSGKNSLGLFLLNTTEAVSRADLPGWHCFRIDDKSQSDKLKDRVKFAEIDESRRQGPRSLLRSDSWQVPLLKSKHEVAQQ